MTLIILMRRKYKYIEQHTKQMKFSLHLSKDINNTVAFIGT